MVARKAFSPSLTLWLSLAEIPSAIIVCVVTATLLDNPNGDCWLNLIPGRVCDFVYSSTGFSIFFSLILLVPTFFWLRGENKNSTQPVLGVVAPMALFAAFWNMVLAIAITQRGKQASGKGYPEGAARSATMAFAWITAALFFFNFVAVLADRYLHWKAKQAEHKDDDDISESESKEQYVYTRALAQTPIS